ncbi:hypothetical protein VITU102760_12185 [Vibrio tubiashii]|uniref:Uncharacterized protein n=1 Tax=Vibrio tubiashii ATCC 19109 TaxID=1051646 RepID=F9SZX9_9VIBR|nr:hypothetical protein [Vibrio tubiashii]AIW16290.1 hypothetical protein IX91_19550 [Vibrio tubiashii ATCC 19109]EGU59057.1 hypothetical protein VITU9109_18925 [Vibrio tubiashii ATCC 19109]EIF05939.1 hypothetical protein VT1337_00825 [Vibrio tubiashii NCIMB 1337 = ATCC 19106]
MKENEEQLELNEELQTLSSEDKNDFLKELEEEFDPEAALEKQETEKQEKQAKADGEQMMLQAAKEGALTLMGGLEMVIQEAADPRLEIGEENAVKVAEAAAPVILKYNVEPPEWAVKYKEEIGLGLAVATVGLSLFLQHRQLKKADRLEALRAKQAEEAEQAA